MLPISVDEESVTVRFKSWWWGCDKGYKYPLSSNDIISWHMLDLSAIVSAMSTFVKYLPISILMAAIFPLVMAAFLLSPYFALGGKDDPIEQNSPTAFRKIPARALSLLEDKTLRIQTENLSATIPAHLQPREIRDAIEYGHDALKSLVDARSLVLVGNLSEDTRLMLLGGLKGGMKGTGTAKGNTFCGPNACVSGGYGADGKLSFTIQPIAPPTPVQKPDQNWSSKFSLDSAGFSSISQITQNYWDNEHYAKVQQQHKKQLFRKQEELYNQYLQDKAEYDQYIKDQQISANLPIPKPDTFWIKAFQNPNTS